MLIHLRVHPPPCPDRDTNRLERLHLHISLPLLVRDDTLFQDAELCHAVFNVSTSPTITNRSLTYPISAANVE